MESAPLPEVPPPRRSRLKRILIWTGSSFGALLLVILIGGPPIIASIVRSKLQSTLDERVDGKATVGSVSFSWFSGVTIRDVEIKDRAGAPAASVKSVRADVGVMAALGGRIIANARVDSPRLEVRRGADGNLNLTSLMKPTGATPTPNAPSGPTTIPRDLPYFNLKLTLDSAVAFIAGEKESTQFDVSGAFDLTHDAGVVTLSGSCAVKEGTVKVDAEADLNGGAKLEVKLVRVPIDARMGPILELLHPALSAAGGNLDGAMDGALSLKYGGPLIGAAEDQILKGISGNGQIEIRDCTFAGSQFLGQLMTALSMEKRDVKLKPLEFRIADGRIHYDKPWQWTISGSETTFTGSIGLDRTLDMVWHIPVTDALASKLKVAKGQTYEIGIKGTVTRPRLDMKDAIKQVAEEKIEDAAKKGIESLLGGKDEKKAEKLLEEADALHKDGKTADAAAKYRKIKDDYRKTRVYKDNKDRIDPRAEGK